MVLIKVGSLVVANCVKNGKDVEKKFGKKNSNFLVL